MHEACSNASHTLFNAREEVNQLKKDEGNSVTVSQEEDSICFWWIGHFQWGISYSLWFQICRSMGDVHQDPWGAAFSQFRTVTITDLQANLPLTRPLPPTHHLLLRKAVVACAAMLDCLQRTVLGGVLLSSFSSCTGGPRWRWQYYQGEQQNHNMPL